MVGRARRTARRTSRRTSRRVSRRQEMMRGGSTPPAEEYYEPAPAPAPAESAEVDPYEKLKEAKKLLDEGILTQEEFEAEKKKILG